jgi:hypothetical protein
VGANLAELHMMSAVVTSYAATTITPVGAFPTNCSNPGADGSIYTETAIPANMYVNVTAGAEGTRQALFLSTRGLDNRLSSVDGPIISFDPAQPQVCTYKIVSLAHVCIHSPHALRLLQRVTYYTRLQPVAEVSNKPNFGALFTLMSRSSNLTAQETQAGGPTGNTSLSQVNEHLNTVHATLLCRAPCSCPPPSCLSHAFAGPILTLFSPSFHCR